MNARQLVEDDGGAYRYPVAYANADLETAVDDGDQEAALIALSNGADIHTRQDYAIRFAVRNAVHTGDYKLVTFLLDHGADVHIYHEEPLRNAIYGNGAGPDEKLVKLLIQAGACPYGLNAEYLSKCGLSREELVKLAKRNLT